MKLRHIFSFLLFSLLFAGCASTGERDRAETESSSSTEQVEEVDQTGSTKDGGLLMDQYRSGRIPGYRN